ncbi:MAG: LytTR family transcriptional regulator DNA-binding domain-containing protein [Oscillospiraceae bacterium]|nr:LytTR family transcriptional regulator DNA-binding domain-containing protein [Oscillospiraceae bacterium]
MTRIAIADNDNVIIGLMKQYIMNYQREKNIQFKLYTFNDCTELINSEVKTDLIFIDVEMPGEDAIKAAKQIRKKDKLVKIVCMMSRTEFSISLFAVHPFDVLKKPVKQEKLVSVLDEYSEYSQQQNRSPMVSFRSDTGIIVINTLDVIAFEYIHNRGVMIYMKNKNIEIRASIKEVMKSINSDIFTCPHKSFIVNIKEIRKISDFTIVMSNGLIIPAAQKRYKEIKNLLLTSMSQS